MLRFALLRALLVALPFAVWFIWARIAKARGKPMGAAPWAWLVAAGLLLAAASLLLTGLIGTTSPRNAAYVPVESGPSGAMVPGPR